MKTKRITGLACLGLYFLAGTACMAEKTYRISEEAPSVYRVTEERGAAKKSAQEGPEVPLSRLLGREEEVLRREIATLAEGLFRNLADKDPENGDLANGVVVCTFVDLNRLTRTSSLGRYLAEQLMTEVQQRRYRVLELRKSRAITVQEKYGEYGLSREPAELGTQASAGAMLTGTYTIGRDGVIINARIIDNRSAHLLSSATAVIPKNRLAETLLLDSASMRLGRVEPMYMKKLEL